MRNKYLILLGLYSIFSALFISTNSFARTVKVLGAPVSAAYSNGLAGAGAGCTKNLVSANILNSAWDGTNKGSQSPMKVTVSDKNGKVCWDNQIIAYDDILNILAGPGCGCTTLGGIQIKPQSAPDGLAYYNTLNPTIPDSRMIAFTVLQDTAPTYDEGRIISAGKIKIGTGQ